MTKFCVKSVLLFFIGWFMALEPVSAQLRQPAPPASEILGAIRKLNVLGSVLYFAAHPDDENTRLIAWLANERKYRTAYLSLTRGDGGQNLIGTELAEELGMIRTQELLVARQLDGGEQYFSRANDFGFSKTPEETLAFWGEEPVLADAVWIIRKLKPDVIITRFPPDPRGGHGHHQAATLLAIEAFSAAADPGKFPEQLDHGVEPWQAKRLLWNTANFGGQNNTSPDQYSIDIGDYNPLIGKSYGEIAAESRSSHKSQGFGAARQRGSNREFFETLEGPAPKADLLDGVNTTWSRVEGTDAIPVLIRTIEAKFDVTHPELVLPDLLQLLGSMEQLADGYWKTQKIDELKAIILACAGIWFESYAAQPKYAIGDQVKAHTDFIVRRPGVDVTVHKVSYHAPVAGLSNGQAPDPENTGAGSLEFNKLYSRPGFFTAGQVTQPYWLRQPRQNELYTVADMEDVGQPDNQDDPYALIELDINGKRISYRRPVVYKYTDPVQGEVYQPLSIAPVVTADVREKALVFANGAGKELDIVFTSHTANPQQIVVNPQVPRGWTVSPERIELSFQRENEEISRRILLKPGSDSEAGAGQQGSLTLLLQSEGNTGQPEPARMIRTIDHPHIPLLTYYPATSVKLSEINGSIPVRRIGYIPGAGDLVPDALRQIGIEVEILEENDVLGQDLSRYEAIVSGVRAYNVNARMQHIHARLMDYVAQGGTYLVQYNVNTRLQTEQLGPHPFRLSRLRVTDERAPVRFILPDNRVLNYPNRITEADFEGWIQERGLYFATDVDPAYQMPLSMNDQGELPLDGSLLVAGHGKGKFVYTSLAFFRQLPAGVPGAYRLFMNLIAKPERE